MVKFIGSIIVGFKLNLLVKFRVIYAGIYVSFALRFMVK